MPKIMKSDAKLSEIYEQKKWHLFSGQCNLRAQKFCKVVWGRL